MRKFIQNKLKEQKGLTLIELLAVIVILAIVAAIAIPAIGNVIENSRYGAIKSDATNIMAAADVYYADGNEGASVTATILKSKGYLDDAGSFAEATVTKSATAPSTISGNSVVGNVKLTLTGATRNDVKLISKDNIPIRTDVIKITP
ncbi:prepilin-type N-terminal cleavage/methylation domain-containing protein [Paenisporosarcina sp. HGH0030]|uniref:prepilin-type N-terminal cleavage/methylation domain-containing protein n=1 Tax=Paenisporosarcina sp. HGH0030 TaxID=1078085 RepID=UPI00034E7A6C|nr:prepilin-type N-terminal cleavage/methylation domain-containing protein [Paenisporosarcina sp. HGH0030]EPD54281.1 prepilin-type N-terminal cleavage/methylation domain-containing protein [Paenisporosarcina sp. HGH0030]